MRERVRKLLGSYLIAMETQIGVPIPKLGYTRGKAQRHALLIAQRLQAARKDYEARHGADPQ